MFINLKSETIEYTPLHLSTSSKPLRHAISCCWTQIVSACRKNELSEKGELNNK